MYGDEIGIGEDLSEFGRFSVRPPMQWTAGRNAGFSTAPIKELVQRPISTGKFSFKNVNVEKQLEDENSFLLWMRKLAKIRKECPEIGWGTWHIQDVNCPSMFVHICEWKGKSFLAAHNLGKKACKFDLDLKHSNASKVQPLLGQIAVKNKDNCLYHFTVPGYGYGWFKLDKKG